MSMLDNIRKGIDSSGVRLAIGGLLFVFIFWGVNGRDSRGGAGVVASVNGQAITDTERIRAVRQELARAGRGLSKEAEAGIVQLALQRLITEEVMVQEAERLGIAVSEEEVQRAILSQSGFKDADGKFDAKALKQALRNMNLNQGTYEEMIRRDLLRQKLTEILLRNVTLSDDETYTLFQKLQTKVSLQFVRIPTTSFLSDIVIADADRDAFIAQNKAKIEERYKADYDRRYNLPRRYTLSLILLRTDIPGVDEAAVQAKANEIQAKAAAGEDFATLAKTWSEDLTASSGGGLGTRPVAQFDPAEVAAADAVGAGKVTAVFKTSRGFEILQVQKVEDAKIIALEEATPDIAVAMMKEEKVGKIASDFANNLLSSWSQNKFPPTELLAAHQLLIEATPDFPVANPNIPTLGENAEITAALAGAAEGTVLPKVYEIRGLSYVVAVGHRTVPSKEEFDAQKGMIHAQLLRERQNTFAQAWADEVTSHADVQIFTQEQEQAQK